MKVAGLVVMRMTGKFGRDGRNEKKRNCLPRGDLSVIIAVRFGLNHLPNGKHLGIEFTPYFGPDPLLPGRLLVAFEVALAQKCLLQLCRGDLLILRIKFDPPFCLRASSCPSLVRVQGLCDDDWGVR